MMGPSHALSGVATWSVVTAGAAYATGTPPEAALLIMGSVMTAGAALAPDFDSGPSTVVRSFGIFGKGAHHLVDILGTATYNLTATKYDGHKEGGHRTLFHTGIMAILMGMLVATATLSTSEITLFGETYILGRFVALIIMGVCLNLALGGLFEGFKKWRKRFGPYLLMIATIVVTFLFSFLIPEQDGTYAWLGIAVGLGWFTHLMGDLITKMGVPLLWPIKIRGHRWWDVSLPSFLRISAGGAGEKLFYVPLFTVLIILSNAYNIYMILGGTIHA